MDKFIKIVVGSDERLVRVSDVVAVDAPLTTSTTITYVNGAVATLTNAAATGDEMVVAVEGLIAKALVTPWTDPVYDATAAGTLPQAVSALAVA